MANTVGVMDISGGTFADSGFITIGRGTGTHSGILNVTGGNVTAARVEIDWATTTAQISVVNVGGGAGAASISTTGSATIGLGLTNANVAGTQGIVNLLTNGTFTTGIVTTYGANANSTALLDFNGGTLKATALNAGANFLTSVNVNGSVYVYGGNGTIDNGGGTITIGKTLLSPAAGSGTTATPR